MWILTQLVSQSETLKETSELTVELSKIKKYDHGKLVCHLSNQRNFQHFQIFQCFLWLANWLS